jgi:hypothetical protein
MLPGLPVVLAPHSGRQGDGRNNPRRRTTMTEQSTTTKKPAFIAYDPTRWAGETEATSLGVVFSHRDGNGYDLLLDAVPLTGTLVLHPTETAASDIQAPSTGVPAKRPDYHAYVVGDRKDSQGKARWRFIGHAYRHADGQGLDVLYRTIPTNGRIALRLNDQK